MASRKSLNFRQSSSCSSYLFISERSAAIAVASRLISSTLSCLALASTSAFLIASCTFSSFSLRNASKRSASSSSICSLFFSASSRCRARSSSFLISARFVSSDICSRKISRFFAMKSAMFSFSLRRSGAALVVASVSPPFLALGGRSVRISSRASCVVVACIRDAKVDFAATDCCRASSRSWALRARSSSLCLKMSSSAGTLKGLADGSMAMVAASSAIVGSMFSMSNLYASNTW
mmetsp:Transcript_29333/g.74739  ORF Transcript_29333/g.74739 Transcript_29333/m.74739 type:complete len:236 (+) Transcript_29333:601-1308(+)